MCLQFIPSIDNGRPERRVAGREGGREEANGRGGREGQLQTSVQRRKSVQCSIVLIHSSTEVVCSKTVAAHLKMDAPNCIKQECAEALPGISHMRGLWGRAKHLESFAIVASKEFNISLPELSTRSLSGGGRQGERKDWWVPWQPFITHRSSERRQVLHFLLTLLDVLVQQVKMSSELQPKTGTHGTRPSPHQ